MLTFIFSILMIVVFGNIVAFAVKMAWGVSKIVINLILLPVILIGMVLAGLFWLAIPLLVVIGLISLFAMNKS